MAHKLFFVATFLLCLSSCKFQQYEFWYKDRPSRRYTQIDRVGKPGVSLIAVNSANLGRFNSSNLSDDNDDEVRDSIIENIGGLHSILATIDGLEEVDDPKTPEEVADFLLPDVINIDLSKPVTSSDFNGRRHGDYKAMDQMMELVFNRKNITSSVDPGIDTDSGTGVKLKFIDGFPYLAKAKFSE